MQIIEKSIQDQFPIQINRHAAVIRSSQNNRIKIKIIVVFLSDFELKPAQLHDTYHKYTINVLLYAPPQSL